MLGLSEPPAGVKRTGGRWDRNRWPTYFIAADIDSLVTASACHADLLVAINELPNAEAVALAVALIDGGSNALIDSGVFWLASQHAERHGMPLAEAFGMAPEQVEGFPILFDRYVSLARSVGHQAWGYIEFDLGGMDNKRRMRQRVEAMGLAPIPVYHPLNDPPEYFDELAREYDRLAVGNLVAVEPALRKRLLATLWERRRAYPWLWIHALGVTPSEVTGAYPMNSCDRSTWLAGVRWGYLYAWAANRRLWDTGKGLLYDPSTDPESARGHQRARRLAGYDSHMTAHTMRAIAAEWRDRLGADPGLYHPREPDPE